MLGLVEDTRTLRVTHSLKKRDKCFSCGEVLKVGDSAYIGVQRINNRDKSVHHCVDCVDKASNKLRSV